MAPVCYSAAASSPVPAGSPSVSHPVFASAGLWLPKGSPVSCAASELPKPGSHAQGVAHLHGPPPSLASSSPPSEKSPSTISPAQLASGLTIDAVAAGLASFGVSPFVTVIDRSIVRNAAGVQTLRSSVSDGFRELFSRPLRCLTGRDFRIVFGVYAGTYLGANSAVTLANYFNQSEPRTELLKFVAATAANMYLCIRKDIIFAKLFGSACLPQTASGARIAPGPHGPAKSPTVSRPSASQSVQKIQRAASRRFPLISTLLFVCRDCLTIAASFNAPSHAARWLSAGAADDEQADRKSVEQALSRGGGSTTTSVAGATTDSLHSSASADNQQRMAALPGKRERLSTSSDATGRSGQEGLPARGEALADTTRIRQPLRQRLAMEKASAHSMAQLLCPVGVQFVSTPLHLLSLDLYNRPGIGLAERGKFLRGAYLGTVAARSARILPAFGIGGILNTKTKETLQRLASDSGPEKRAEK